jgi:hypothetical protein
MESGLFRQKSVERISSPEDLHEYMRVTSPRLWMILIAILVLLAGFIIFASTATMENTMAIQVHAENFPSYVKNEQGEYVEGPPETMMTAMMSPSSSHTMAKTMSVFAATMSLSQPEPAPLPKSPPEAAADMARVCWKPAP